MVDCVHLSPGKHFGTCAIGLYGGRPSPGVCLQCPHKNKSPDDPTIAAAKVFPIFPAVEPAPTFGPGTELHKILQTLGIKPSASCSCRARIQQMDEWEVAGCIEHRQEIIEWMVVGWLDWGWKEKIVAASFAIKTGLAFKFNPLDPFPGLVDEAIRRAAERLADSAAQKACITRGD